MTVRAEIHDVPTPNPPREVTLTMPYDVAVTLYELIGWHVSGSGKIRKHTTAIWEALTNAGFDSDKATRFTGTVAVER